MLESFLSNRTVSVLAEALPRILSAGLTMTIPLTIISFVLAMLIATVVALVQYARVPVLRQIARFYIWVIRGTPLLVQLFIIFYGLPSVGILLDAFPAAVIAFCHQRRRLLRRDHACGIGIRAPGPAGGWVLRWYVLVADHASHRAAPSATHSCTLAVQFLDRHGQGHLSGLQYHGC